MMMRLLLPVVICGSLIIGVILGHIVTRPVVAAFAVSDAVSKQSGITHEAIRIRGTIRALPPDGYIMIETKDMFGFVRTVSLLGKADNREHLSSLQVGDYVSAKIRRSSGLINFSGINLLLRGGPVTS